jgi:hypothetical protein
MTTTSVLVVLPEEMKMFASNKSSQRRKLYVEYSRAGSAFRKRAREKRVRISPVKIAMKHVTTCKKKRG